MLPAIDRDITTAEIDLPFVTIIIPCRDEKNFIQKCVDSVIAQDYPKDRIEVFIVDGMSDDGTRELICQYIEKYAFIKCFDNPKRIVPTALNAGIRKSRGEIIIRMDAHNVYETDYVSNCVKYLNEYGADNVGGIWINIPTKEGVIPQSIAMALSRPFGVGNAYYRIGLDRPKYVDTVPFGCYRREVFDRIGMFDEEMLRNEDDEFNFRLTRKGGKVLIAPEIVSYYYARDSLLKLFRTHFQYGYFKPLVAQKVGAIMTWRQLIPSVFIGSLMFSFALSFVFKEFLWVLVFILSLYLGANIACSLRIAIKEGLKYFLALPIVFWTIHVSYGIGYLKGIWEFIVLRKNKRGKVKNVTLAR